MNHKCKATTTAGRRCQRYPGLGRSYCQDHDPERRQSQEYREQRPGGPRTLVDARKTIVRLEANQRATLEHISAQTGETKSAIIRRAIDQLGKELP